MQTPKIAILVDTATGWGRRLIRGVLDYSIQHGPWDVSIEPKGQNEPFSLERHADLDGVIARISSVELAQELAERNIPTVNVSGLDLEGFDFPRVSIDWIAAAKLAESHFRDRALANFGYVGPVHLAHVRQHERSFEQVLAASGTHCHVYQPQASLESASDWEPSEDRLIAWLEALPKPIGIYTWAFQVGRKVISACRRADIPVPHDVAVLGGDYDDLLCDACHPALSGIVTPAKQVGQQAAAVLDSLIRGDKTAPSPIFIAPQEVEERRSTEILAISDPRTLQAISYLRAHACEPIQVADILKKVPMARRSLERRFAKQLGRTPAQEILRLRINHARHLLANTNLPIQEIAEACGYSTYNYLGNLFKRETGLSPGKYRQQAQGR